MRYLRVNADFKINFGITASRGILEGCESAL